MTSLFGTREQFNRNLTLSTKHEMVDWQYDVLRAQAVSSHRILPKHSTFYACIVKFILLRVLNSISRRTHTIHLNPIIIMTVS